MDHQQLTSLAFAAIAITTFIIALRRRLYLDLQFTIDKSSLHPQLIINYIKSSQLYRSPTTESWSQLTIRDVLSFLVRLIMIPLLYPMNLIWYVWSIQAHKFSHKLFVRILNDNKSTVFGLEHDFASIKDMDEYREKIPLAESKDVQPYVKRMQAGESNVLFSTDVAKYFLTSGTSSGVPSIIPCSNMDLKLRAFLFGPLMMSNLLKKLGPTTVYYRGMSCLMSSSGEVTSEFNTESSLKAGIKGFASPAGILWTAPMVVNEISSITSSYILQWVFALIYKDTAYILDEYSSKFVYLMKVLIDHHESIFQCIETGIPPRELDTNTAGYQDIAKAIRASPRRAMELRMLFKASSERNHKGLVKILLPNIRYVACICTGSFSVYESSIRHYIGESLPIYNVAYGASEAYVARSLDVNDNRYMICPTSGIFEFIPQDKEEAAAHEKETKLFDELIPNHKYEVVYTTQSGLYRYRSHDIIQCTGYQQALPIFKFLYRDNVLLNICAESVYGDQIQFAMRQVEEELGIAFTYYSIAVDFDKTPAGYRFFVELAPSSYDVENKEIERKAEAVLAKALCKVNLKYKHREARGRISHPSISFVQEGTYSELEQMIYKAKMKEGLSYGQVKVPTCLRADGHKKLIEFLQQCVIN